LTLGAAPVFGGAQLEPLAQHVEQRQILVGYLDVGAVDAEPDQGIS
jgi:hypothetical protein